MLKALDEMEESKVVRLGDASIASPFTSKHSSINSGQCILMQSRSQIMHLRTGLTGLPLSENLEFNYVSFLL